RRLAHPRHAPATHRPDLSVRVLRRLSRHHPAGPSRRRRPGVDAMTTLILFATFLACLAAGMPILWTMGVATLAALTLGEVGLPAPWMAQQVIRGADSIYLSAIPLFLFSGELMNRGGITNRL